jgi:hypothetical protein
MLRSALVLALFYDPCAAVSAAVVSTASSIIGFDKNLTLLSVDPANGTLAMVGSCGTQCAKQAGLSSLEPAIDPTTGVVYSIRLDDAIPFDPRIMLVGVSAINGHLVVQKKLPLVGSAPKYFPGNGAWVCRWNPTDATLVILGPNVESFSVYTQSLLRYSPATGSLTTLTTSLTLIGSTLGPNSAIDPFKQVLYLTSGNVAAGGGELVGINLKSGAMVTNVPITCGVYFLAYDSGGVSSNDYSAPALGGLGLVGLAANYDGTRALVSVDAVTGALKLLKRVPAAVGPFIFGARATFDSAARAVYTMMAPGEGPTAAVELVVLPLSPNATVRGVGTVCSNEHAATDCPWAYTVMR